MKSIKTLCVIPVRYDSSRFPGKPLTKIAGKPLMQWTWEGAIAASKIDQVVIATDDDRIEQVACGFGATVVRTGAECRNGTERCAQVLKNLSAKLVLNVQGDEPLITGGMLDALVEGMNNFTGEMGTLATDLSQLADLQDQNVVKVVCNQYGNALYFSRHPIGAPIKSTQIPSHVMCHIGVYAYRSDFLTRYAKLPLSTIEQTERLEQLRALYYGARVLVVRLDETLHGINTPHDVPRVESLLRKRFE